MVQLSHASRTESKKFRDQIEALNMEKNRMKIEMTKIEGQVEKKNQKIEKMNESIFKVSIKNVSLGKDAKKDEYWFFKDDPSRLYVKMFEEEVEMDYMMY